ncbi:MAG: hypothetical protein HUJ68_03010 [Clostridia bacterium]|nr:hypothetical protein [Clostridia bacterium]
MDDMLKNFFIGNFQFDNKIVEKSIINLAEKNTVGNEDSYCTYEKDDEDYKEGFVAVLFFEPFVKEDVVLYYENKIFYDELFEFLKTLVDASTKMRELDAYLTKIRNDLNI